MECGMTIDQLLKTLAREYPSGVSFDPMAVRLLRQKIPVEDKQIEELKSEMFQMGDGLWFSREMISDNKICLAFRELVTKWLLAHGCFSVERLVERYCGLLSHISTPENVAAYLRHLGFTVAVWERRGLFCFQPPLRLDEWLAATSKTIVGRIVGADGTLALTDLEEALPHLTAEALAGIRKQFLPEVHEVEIGGVTCWRSAEAIHLPEDFDEKLTIAVDTLVDLEEKVSAANLEFALNLFYRLRFREEYFLPDNGTFMRVCAKHYQGGNGVFPNTAKHGVKTNDYSAAGGRVRGAVTRFRNLGVPIGANLVYTKDAQITCTVLDDSNHLEYDGKPWSISGLASHLLNASAANGYCYFSYEGETLWERRVRLERDGKQDEHPAVAIVPQGDEGRGSEGEIIGVEGKVLSPATWRAFRSAGINPRVTGWAQRVANGESVETIARESGLMVSTVNEYIKNRRRYLAVCEKNGIAPEGGANV
jgi:hypothetical protein